MAHLTDQEQAALFHARGRSRSFRNPTLGLFLSTTFATGQASVDPTALFPGGLDIHPVTFEWEMAATGVSPAGVVFEFGDNTTGLKVNLLADDIGIAVGDGAGGGGLSIDSINVPRLLELGSNIHCVLAINPSKSSVRFWVNGTSAGGRVNASQMTNGWSGTALGSIGAAINGGSNDRAAPNEVGAPVDFAMTPLSVYYKQLPRQMD